MIEEFYKEKEFDYHAFSYNILKVVQVVITLN
jgi:hypothetical protein